MAILDEAAGETDIFSSFMTGYSYFPAKILSVCSIIGAKQRPHFDAEIVVGIDRKEPFPDLDLGSQPASPVVTNKAT